MKTHDEHEAILSLFLYGINWNDSKSPPSCVQLECNVHMVIQKAINEQTQIGWGNICKGFISAEWAKAQTLYTNHQLQ